VSDNFLFDLTGVPLEKSMEIAFLGSSNRKAVGWTEEDMEGGVPRLILYWTETDKSHDMTRFPAPLDAAAVVAVVRHWLGAVKYAPEPDPDGDNSKGCRVHNEAWGRVGGRWQAFVAIEPVWLEYGK
jgi:hypothetical protein